jgi:predicted DNA-binding protein
MKENLNSREQNQIKLALPSDIREWLKAQARKRGISDEIYIKEILTKYVTEKGKEDFDKPVEFTEGENNRYKKIIEELYEILRKF